MSTKIRAEWLQSERLTAEIRYVDRIIEGDTDVYEGPYTVRPELDAQTLTTAGKVMQKNLQIEEIPITTVSNTAGGKTVIIG